MKREDALKKIKKCLALSRSAESHEAAAALRQAQKLMEQFNLQEGEIALADVREVRAKAVSAAANLWEVRLANLVADAFGCEKFSQLVGAYNAAGNWIRSRYYVFVGVDAAADVAGYAFEVLSRQCARDRLAHIGRQPKNCKAITKTARGDAFAKGWVLAVQALVERFSRSTANETLLLQYLEAKHPDLANEKTRDATRARKTDLGHYMAGHKAGEKAQLHHSMGVNTPQALLT